MPGIVVLLDPNGRPGVSERFERQIEAARLHAWYQVDRWVDPAGRVALGRCDLGIFNRAAQPVVCPQGRFRLVFQGDLYDRAARLAALARRGVPLTGADNPDLLLATYRTEGLAGVGRLNGSYFFALWDTATAKLVVGGDRYASRPHMYALEGGRLVLAPEVAGVMAGLASAPAPDWQGLGTFLALEYPLADHTFVEGIRVFPGGTFLVVEAGQPRWVEYWRPRYVVSPERPIGDWVEEAAARYRQAIQRTTEGDCCLAINGGTDSRTLLACHDGSPLPAYTFGQPGSDDVVIADQVARARGVVPTVMHLREDYLHHYAAPMMRFGEGMTSLFHGHDADGLEAVRAIAPVVLYGMTSEFARTEFAQNVLATPAHSVSGRLALLARHLREGRRPLDTLTGEIAMVERLAARTWTAVDAATAQAVLTPAAARAMRQAVLGGLAAALAQAEGPTPVDRLMAFNVLQRQRRFTSWGIKIAGTAHEFRKPLDDYDLVDFLLTVPPDIRQGLQAQVVTRLAPDLAAIRRTGSGVAMDASFAARAVAFGRKRLVQSLWPGRRQSFADPQALLRTTSREFFEDLLRDPATARNGLVNPAGLRALVEAHMAGRADAASALCAIATVELWRRSVLGGARLEVPGASPFAPARPLAA